MDLPGQDGVITLPAINQARETLGIEDISKLVCAADDSNDEDENPPTNVPEPTTMASSEDGRGR